MSTGFETTYGLWNVIVGSTGLGGISRVSVPPGAEVASEPTDGQVYSRFATVRSQKPRATFDAFSIKSALNLCGMSGLSLASSNLTLWAAGQEDGGSRALSASKKYMLVKGLLVPERISSQHGSDATISYGAYAAWDGTNDPLATQDGTAPAWDTAPAGYDERFTVGPCLVGGNVFYGVRSIDISFGFVVRSESADGEVWPRIVSIQSCNPSVTIRGLDLRNFGSSKIPLAGKATSNADTKIFLRRRKQQGGVWGNSDAKHVLINVPGLCVIEQAHDASGNGLSECTASITAIHDGTNLPLVITQDSAITLS